MQLRAVLAASPLWRLLTFHFIMNKKLVRSTLALLTMLSPLIASNAGAASALPGGHCEGEFATAFDGAAAKWEVQPRLDPAVAPYLPEQFRRSAFEGGVSVDLVLNEKGQVIRARVTKPAQQELEVRTLEAARTSEKNAKAKSRALSKFVYTSSASEASSVG